MRFACVGLLAAILFGGIACRRSESTNNVARGEVTVAAAANLTQVFQDLGPQFESQTGIHPVFSFASTAQLTQQIENSAPFDVIAAADAEHVDELDRKNLLVKGSVAVYAIGVLALWIPARSGAAIRTIEDLVLPQVQIIAVAKPEVAPYGQATVDTLHRLGIWGKVNSKLVYAENISMAKQYGTSGNADAVFTAYSLVLKEPGNIIQVDDNLHRPIKQELGIVAKSQHQDAAHKFVDFLLQGKGKDILRIYGYRVAG